MIRFMNKLPPVSNYIELPVRLLQENDDWNLFKCNAIMCLLENTFNACRPAKNKVKCFVSNGNIENSLFTSFSPLA